MYESPFADPRAQWEAQESKSAHERMMRSLTQVAIRKSLVAMVEVTLVTHSFRVAQTDVSRSHVAAAQIS